jgi:hypothetical protein
MNSPTPSTQPDPDLLALLESTLPMLEYYDAREGCAETLHAVRKALEQAVERFKVGLTRFRRLSEARSYALDRARKFPDQHFTVRTINDDIIATYHQGAETPNEPHP